jgi:hypothetical protein
MYCSSLYEHGSFLFFDQLSIRSFYISRSGSYNETRGPTGGSDVIETLYSI